MKWGALVGWGIVIYAVVFLAWSLLVARGVGNGALAPVVMLLVLIAVSLCAGRALRMHTWRDILPYSISWAVIAMLFDALMIEPLYGWGMYSAWNVWAAYCLVAVVPLFAPSLLRGSSRGSR